MVASINYLVFTAAFLAYTLAVVAVGLYSARFAKRSDEDYFLADRSLGKWVAALSASASSESGWVTLGLVGMGFRFGLRAYWIVPGCLGGFLFIWFVLAGRMRDRSQEVSALTLTDFFARHFNERLPLLRVLSVLIILVAMLLYVAAQFAAAGKAFAASFEQVSYPEGVLVGGAIVLFYTVSGGFRAVCWTDLLQALLMVLALVAFPLYVLAEHGGYQGLSQMVADMDANRFGFVNREWNFMSADKLFSFTPDKAGWALLGFVFGSSALGINFGYSGQPHVLVRFMALKDRGEVRAAGAIAFTWATLVLWGAVTTGLAVKALTLGGAEWGMTLLGPQGAAKEVVDAASERALVLGSIHLLPEVVSGMVLAAVLAAICSTADSQLVVAASAAASDLYARLFAKNKEGNHVLVNRAVVLGLGVGAVLLVVNERVTVYNLVLEYGWAILGAAFGPQVILTLLWKRASYAGCLAGMLTGFLAPIAWKLWYDPAATGIEVYNLPFGFICALLVNVTVSLALGPRRRLAGGSPA